MESYTWLVYEAIGRVARLTLNRPEKLNALSVDLHTELLQAAKQAEADPRIHAVVIRGAGRAFCSGADIRGFNEQVERRKKGASSREPEGTEFDSAMPLTIPTPSPARRHSG